MQSTIASSFTAAMLILGQQSAANVAGQANPVISNLMGAGSGFWGSSF